MSDFRVIYSVPAYTCKARDKEISSDCKSMSKRLSLRYIPLMTTVFVIMSKHVMLLLAGQTGRLMSKCPKVAKRKLIPGGSAQDMQAHEDLCIYANSYA